MKNKIIFFLYIIQNVSELLYFCRPIISCYIKCSGEIINLWRPFQPCILGNKYFISGLLNPSKWQDHYYYMQTVSPLMSSHNSSLWKPLTANCPVYHATGNTWESTWDLLWKTVTFATCVAFGSFSPTELSRDTFWLYHFEGFWQQNSWHF